MSGDNDRGNAPPVPPPLGESPDVPLHIFHAIANLWLAVQSLTQAGEHVEANHVHLPMERICLKYRLPLAEAELHADLRKMNCEDRRKPIGNTKLCLFGISLSLYQKRKRNMAS